MENEPNKSNSNTPLIIILCVLLVAVIALIGIIMINMLNENQAPATETQLATAIGTEKTPIPSIEVQPTPTVQVITILVTEEPIASPSPSPSPTVIPLSNEDVMWINISYLNVRPEPDFSYDRIISIPYGTRVTGEIDGLWMYTTYNDVSGYIYVGEVKNSDRPCAVPTEAELWPPE